MPKICTLSSPWFFGLDTYFINRFRGIHFSDFSHSLIQIYDRPSRLQICMNSSRKHREKKNTLHSQIKREWKWKVLKTSTSSPGSPGYHHSYRCSCLFQDSGRYKSTKKTSKGWLQPGTQAAILKAGTNKNPVNLNWPGTQNASF